MSVESPPELPDDSSYENQGYFLEVALLKSQIREVVNFQVLPGDCLINADGSGKLAAKARAVLTIGVKHLTEGRPSNEFLAFVGRSIQAMLIGQEPSLDHAFRLVLQAHRPTKDPYADPAILKYLDVIGEHLGSQRSEQTPEQSKKALKNAQIEAINAAYEVRHGASPKDHETRTIDKEAIKKRKASLRNELSRLGHY